VLPQLGLLFVVLAHNDEGGNEMKIEGTDRGDGAEGIVAEDATEIRALFEEELTAIAGGFLITHLPTIDK
jgi:hypothetical protein